MRLLKRRFVKVRLAEKLGCTPNEASNMMDQLSILIKEILAEGKSIQLKGIGKFIIRDRVGYYQRNKQGERVYIEPVKVVAFKRSSTFTFSSLPQ